MEKVTVTMPIMKIDEKNKNNSVISTMSVKEVNNNYDTNDITSIVEELEEEN